MNKKTVLKQASLFLTFTFACLLAVACKSTPPAQPVTNGQSTSAPGTDSASGNQAGQNNSQANQPQYGQMKAGQNQGQQQYPSQQTSQNSQSTRPQPTRALLIPSGTALRVRLDQTLSSRRNQAGDSFSATIEEPVVVQGETVLPRGSSASGTVVQAKSRGHIKGQAFLAIRLDQVRGGGHSYLISTTSVSRVQRGKGRRSAAWAGGGAGIGALIGGLAGGGKGALIGGLAGAGAGTAGGAMTGNNDLVLAAETMLVFRTTRDAHGE